MRGRVESEMWAQALPAGHNVASNKREVLMAKKPAPKKRKKVKAAQQRHGKTKSRSVVQIDAEEVLEGGLFDSGEPTQSGDTQGLSGVTDATFESVKELVEEGQYLEAEVVDGIENAPTSDAGPIKTKEVPEDDVPPEYQVPDRE